MTDERRAQLAAALDAVRRRIARACADAGRRPDDVTLVAVTKNYPAADVQALAELGVTDVGENKDQEAAAKWSAVTAPLRWHYVGRLQRNKAGSVVRYADVVQSVDSVRLAGALDRAAGRHRTTPLDVLVQVSLDGDAQRGGAVIDGADPERDLWRVAEAVAASETLRLRGVMAVAPMNADPDRAFAILHDVASRLNGHHPGADAISAGMSGDLEQAVAHGATHVRIGTSLLGMRKTLR
ncbi:YggS family pyridoxal phosphate-dependent enzyme [Mangrovihabitans endophyticus]|uniref:Pyridoxal phosphate homeostasis protein n=1 Tax=Mangrovihabitans endophyticus TaxID=1751298 RepID=A0A8J3BUB0_9ACTN|nr:YggS family pyridoxal phosphate-dependent enzyme [Mangrovihabitans endophyticus]GGK70601.1 YggS family pyridoxal phosphate enzyme [Mangrovihabitans endophyticus]